MNDYHTSDNTCNILNRILVIHNRSLPVYLSYTTPWIANGRQQEAVEALAHIADDHKATVDRLAELILEDGDYVDMGEFPMFFTAYHDLSIDFLLQKTIEQQKKDIAMIERCVIQLALAPVAKAIAEETLGAAKGHLETLEELAEALSAAKN